MVLAAVLLAGGCGPNNPQPEPSPEPSPTAAPTPSPTPEPVKKNGDIVILYTNDIHCAVDQGFGLDGVREIRDNMEKEGYTTLLVDMGDAVTGNALGTISQGGAVIELMNEMGYDAAVFGNHEFDYGLDRFMELTMMANFPYVCCNFNLDGQLVFPAYLIREVCGKKIAFVGVTTPRVLYRQVQRVSRDETGRFTYDFCQDADGAALYHAVQIAVNAARAEGADYVVALGHLGISPAQIPWTSTEVIENTTGIDVFLDGHSHDKEQKTVKNAYGEEVVRSSCGSKLSALGKLVITADGEISTGIYNWESDTSVTALLGIKNEMTEKIASVQERYRKQLDRVVATSSINVAYYGKNKTKEDEQLRLLLSEETTLGDLCADAFRARSEADIAILNGGGIRKGLHKGEITVENVLNVFNAGTYMVTVEATGQQILDALQWGSRLAPEESSSFLQVSGLSYEIHTYVRNYCREDENGFFNGMYGAYRVKNVMVGDEPLDLEKTYTVASRDYILLNHGDGFNMFNDCRVVSESGKTDAQVLSEYLEFDLEGYIGKPYRSSNQHERIAIFKSHRQRRAS
jgi:2',3'-cyclic-nucleotide 2'-phosphodiesterase (5'-nucleotidase family)